MKPLQTDIMKDRKSIKINILTEGRFHMLDLARELNQQGFDVKLYSFVPTKRAVKFGLPVDCSESFVVWLAPFLLLDKEIFAKQDWSHRLRIRAQDFIVEHKMRKCDLLISLSGSYIKAVDKAKKAGSVIIIERGSKHILEQDRIMKEISTISGNTQTLVPRFNLERELRSYNMADYISIASNHVRESFVKHGFTDDKLFQNPYGTDLSMFKPDVNVKKEYDVIMVGGWSLRKGCDLLTEALKETNLKFLHIGGIVDLPFPQLPNFTHMDSVNQWELEKYYNKAKVAVLASHEEGLAMVQGQEIACGLPLVCTKDTGGEDIAKITGSEKWVVVIPETTVKEIHAGIQKALELYKEIPADGVILGAKKQNLSWTAYGERYAEFIDSLELGGTDEASKVY